MSQCAMTQNPRETGEHVRPAELDMMVALARGGGQMDLLIEIADLFLEDYPKSLAHIREAAKLRDVKRLEQYAHSLKGSVCNFGAPAAVAAASELELKGRASDWNGVDHLVAALADSLDVLKQQLEALK